VNYSDAHPGADGFAARLATIVAEVSDDEVAAADLLAVRRPFAAFGVTSLTQLRLLDAVEAEFGIDIDMGGDLSFLDSLDGLMSYLRDRGVREQG
jgi:acyl carrier protein